MKNFNRAERHDGVNVGFQANYRTSSRRRLPPAMRRSIAMAIELERTHDYLAAHIGHGMPIPNRIVPPGSASGRKVKLNLPRFLSGELLSQMHLDRLNAIETLYAELSETMSAEGEDHLHQLVAEAREIADSEQFIYVTRRRARGASLDPDDRRSVDETHLAHIMRAADNPPAIESKPMTAPDAIPHQRSIAIDLFIDGLLTYHNVDRKKLFKAIDALRRRDLKEKYRESQTVFATPATHSNKHPILQAFGKNFPKAVFRLRGDSLETQSLEMIASDAANDNDFWSYQASVPTNITLSRRSMLKGIPMHDLERRALLHVIPDPRFHPALVIHRADRLGVFEGMPLSRLKLRPSYAYLQPPGSNTPEFPIRLPSDVRHGSGFYGTHEDLKYADLIIAELPQKGINQRYRIEGIDGGGLRLRLADPGRTALTHTFVIKRDTLVAGPEAISTRLDLILASLAKQAHQNGKTVAVSPNSSTASDTAGGSQHYHDMAKPDETLADRFLRLHGAGRAEDWIACERIDALLSDRLAGEDILPDPDIEFHVREGLLAIRTARLAPHIFYRLERFDRVLGKISHAIAILDIDQSMTAASIEALRDGNASQIIKIFPKFGRAQIRKLTRTEQGAQITIRVPIQAKPADSSPRNERIESIP